MVKQVSKRVAQDGIPQICLIAPSHWDEAYMHYEKLTNNPVSRPHGFLNFSTISQQMMLKLSEFEYYNPTIEETNAYWENFSNEEKQEINEMIKESLNELNPHQGTKTKFPGIKMKRSDKYNNWFCANLPHGTTYLEVLFHNKNEMGIYTGIVIDPVDNFYVYFYENPVGKKEVYKQFPPIIKESLQIAQLIREKLNLSFEQFFQLHGVIRNQMARDINRRNTFDPLLSDAAVLEIAKAAKELFWLPKSIKNIQKIIKEASRENLLGDVLKKMKKRTQIRQKTRKHLGEPEEMREFALAILEQPGGKKDRARRAVSIFPTKRETKTGLCKELEKEMYKDELYELALELDLPVTSKTKKKELCKMIAAFAEE